MSNGLRGSLLRYVLISRGTSLPYSAFSYIASGSLIIQGQNTSYPNLFYSASGNISISGEAGYERNYSYIATGGIVIAGTSPIIRLNWFYTGSGNICLGGDAFVVNRSEITNCIFVRWNLNDKVYICSKAGQYYVEGIHYESYEEVLYLLSDGNSYTEDQLNDGSECESDRKNYYLQVQENAALQLEKLDQIQN